MTDDQLTRLANAAGNIQNDGVTLQIAAKRGDSIDKLRRLFVVVQDSWECLAEVWQEIDGTPDLDQPLTIDWLREHVPGEWSEGFLADCWALPRIHTEIRWAVRRNPVATKDYCRSVDIELYDEAGHQEKILRIAISDSSRITIRDAIAFFKLAGVPLKGVE